MLLKIVTSEDISRLDKFFTTIEHYNPNVYKDRSKAFKTKGAYGARLDPFAVILEDGEPIKAFYSEVNECTIDNIINYVTEKNKAI